MARVESPSGLVILNRHLPSDIISHIISRLPVEDIIRCTSVSTDLYHIIKNLQSNHLHNTKSQLLDILLSKTGDRSLGYVCFNDSLHMISSNSKRIDGKCKHVEIPHQNELTGRVIGSCNGLLCLSHSMESPLPCAIYNPITKESMMLPQLERHPQCDNPFPISSFGFGYDPINNKYKVVVAYDYRCYTDDQRFLLKATGDIITLGESSWRRLQFHEVEGEGRFDTYLPAVFVNGSFHWVNGRQLNRYEYREKTSYQLDGILTLDISTEKFNLVNFSAFMDLDVSNLSVFNSENSLVLDGRSRGSRGEDYLGPVPTQVWKLLGTKPDGSCLFQYMALNADEKIREKMKQLLIKQWLHTLVGALDNGNFLFKVIVPGGNLNHLVLYETEKNECSILDVSAEVPKLWDATIFQPSLVSPTSLRKYSH